MSEIVSLDRIRALVQRAIKDNKSPLDMCPYALDSTAARTFFLEYNRAINRERVLGASNEGKERA